MEIICDKCNLPHPPLVECVDAQRRQMASLLLKIGNVDKCPDPCGKTIYWVRHLTGNKAPYTEAGLLHFLDCNGKFKDERRRA